MIHVLKIGGGAGIDSEPVLRNLAARIQTGERWVIVHGASDTTNSMAEQAGIPVQTITSPGGHTSRHTDARMIEIYSAAAAAVNQRIVAQLAAFGVHAAGLAGPNIISARRKAAIRAIRDGRPMVIRDDYSGSINGIDDHTVRVLLDAGLTPVIAPVAMGETFERLNVDGDLVGAQVAQALDANTLIILSNVPGLLRDIDDPASVVSHFTLHEVERYSDLAQGRMKKKLLAAQQANVACVILADARLNDPIDAALSGAGTHITQESTREVLYA